MKSKERLMELYRIAVAREICDNRKEFADFIGTDASTLSKCINGAERYEGTIPTLITRAEAELLKRGVNITPAGDGSGNQHSDVSVNSSIVMERMLDEIKAQRESYEKLLQAAENRHTEDQATIQRLLDALLPESTHK